MHELPQEVASRSGAARRARAALSLLALLLAAAAVPAAAFPGGGGIRLDGALIPAEEVWSEYAYLTRARDMIHPKPAGAIDEKVLGTAVEQVLRRTLLSREAGVRGHALTAEERAGIRAGQVAAWQGEKNYRTALAMLGVTEDYLQHRSELNRLSRKLAESVVAAAAPPTEAELVGFHRDQVARYLTPSSPLRYFLLPLEGGLVRYRELVKEAERLRAEGKSYESLVRRFSIHESAARGGEVPDGRDDAWPHGDTARGVEPGRFSREVRDEAGIHLYARDSRVPLPFASVRARVAADLRERRVAEALGALGGSLRSKARVELVEGPAPTSLAAPPPERH